MDVINLVADSVPGGFDIINLPRTQLLDVITVLGSSVARRDGVSCLEIQLLGEMDKNKFLADSVARRDEHN